MIVYKDQAYTIDLVSNVDFSAATTLEIWYEKPDRETGSITATAGGTGNLTVSADVSDTVNDTLGAWHFQIYAILNTKPYFGSPVMVRCKPSIEVS